MIAVIDSGMGNLGSIWNMLKRIGVAAEVTADPAALERASKNLFPDVRAFDSGMSRINDRGVRALLDSKALEERIPILGICLGMQLLTRTSEEGQLPGVGWIAASTRTFPMVQGLKVPHMGWNAVSRPRDSTMTNGLGPDARFYGSQAVIASIDVKRGPLGRRSVYTVSGTHNCHLDPVEWASTLEARGAGEIPLTSIDREGTWEGFDVDLISSVAKSVHVPVIAHGGAGRLADFTNAIPEARASAIALGSMVVFQKKGMGVLVNLPEPAQLADVLAAVNVHAP
jgi:imidazole glycerol-phosphate synthase subunit HisH